MGSARPATAADTDVLVALVRQALAATRAQRGGLLLADGERRRPPAERVADAIDRPGRVAVAGEFEGAVFGVLLAHTEETSIGAIGVVDELFVEPEAREVGIGDAMVAQAITWVEESGLAGLDIPVLPGDRHMKNLCERSGLSARQIVMHRKSNS